MIDYSKPLVLQFVAIEHPQNAVDSSPPVITNTTIIPASETPAASSDLLSIFLTIDSILRYHCLLPSELRYIIKHYLYEPLTNASIRQAITLWLTYNSSNRINPTTHTTTISSSSWKLTLPLVRYGHISYWDTSNITDMSYLIRYHQDSVPHPLPAIIGFSYVSCFNESIERWDVTNVTTMEGMFSLCTTFNRPLNTWNVSNVTSMKKMFYQCRCFNQPLSNWLTSSVIDMESMFHGTVVFNQLIDTWDVSHVVTMKRMFHETSQFNMSLNP